MGDIPLLSAGRAGGADGAELGFVGAGDEVAVPHRVTVTQTKPPGGFR